MQNRPVIILLSLFVCFDRGDAGQLRASLPSQSLISEWGNDATLVENISTRVQPSRNRTRPKSAEAHAVQLPEGQTRSQQFDAVIANQPDAALAGNSSLAEGHPKRQSSGQPPLASAAKGIDKPAAALHSNHSKSSPPVRESADQRAPQSVVAATATKDVAATVLHNNHSRRSPPAATAGQLAEAKSGPHAQAQRNAHVAAAQGVKAAKSASDHQHVPESSLPSFHHVERKKRVPSSTDAKSKAVAAVPHHDAVHVAQELRPRLEGARAALGKKNASQVLYKSHESTDIAEMVYKVWYFMLCEAAFASLVVASVCLYRTFTAKAICELQLVECRLQLCMLALMACPFLRPYLAYRGIPVAAVYILRCLIEMEALVLVGCRLPDTAFTYTKRCAELMLRSESIKVIKDEKRRKDAIETHMATVQDAEKLLERVHTTRVWIGILMGTRAVLAIVRLVFAALGDVRESTTTKLTWHFAGLMLAMLSLGIVFRRIMPSVEEGGSGRYRTWITLVVNVWGMPLAFVHVRWLVGSLMILMQLQDIFLVFNLGSENVAQMYAACLQIYEVAAVSAWIFALGTQSHAERTIAGAQDPLPWTTRGWVLLRPGWLRACDPPIDKPVPLKDHGNVEDIQPCYALPPEAADRGPDAYEVRSSWRGVLFDIVTTRVRSRNLPVIMLTLTLLHAYDSVGLVTIILHFTGIDASDALSSFLYQMIFLMISVLLWLFAGLALTGNNVFYRKQWLWLTVVAFLVDAGNWANRFNPRDRAQTIGGEPLEKHDMQHVRLMNLWMYFICACISLLGAATTLVVILDGDEHAHFYQTELGAKNYCKAVLVEDKPLSLPPPTPTGSAFLSGRVVSAASVALERLRSRGMKVKRPSLDFPPMLVGAAFATLPLVFALTLFVVYMTKIVLYYARVAQVFAMAMSGTADKDDFFTTFDVNLDYHLSPREVGLTTALKLIGIPELTNAVAALWLRVDRDADGRLSVGEARDFLDHLVAAKHAMLAWLGGDVDAASEGLVSALDDDPKDMALNATELPMKDLELMLQHTSADLAHQLSLEMPSLWHEADQDSDDRLTAVELGDFFRGLKSRVGELKLATTEVALELLHGAAEVMPGNMGELLKSFQEVPNILEHGKATAMRQANATAQEALKIFYEQQKLLQEEMQQIGSEITPAMKSIAAKIAKMSEAISPQDSLNNTLAEAPPLLAVFFAALQRLSELAAAQASAVWHRELAKHGGVDSKAVQLSQTGAASRDKQHRLPADPSSSLTNALPAMVQAAMPPIQDALSRGLLLLGVLRADSSEAAATLVEAFDEPPRDGRLDMNETGLRAILIQISPTVSDSFEEFLRTIGLQDVSLGKAELATLLTNVKAVIKRQGGDMDGDGKITDIDLALALRSYASSLLSSRTKKQENQTAVPHGKAKSLLLQRASGIRQLGGAAMLQEASDAGSLLQSDDTLRSSMLLLDLQQRYGRQQLITDTMSILSGEGAYLQSFYNSLVQQAMEALADTSLTRIEWCLYTSVMTSLCFALYALYNTFAAYVRIFEQCQIGDYSFKGGTHMQELSSRPDFSTFYPGMLMSTVVCSQVLSSILLFPALVLVTSISFLSWVWHLLSWYILWLTLGLFIQLIVLRLFVLDWLCMENGEIARPRLFSCLLTVLTIMNFALGLLFTASRLACMLPFMLLVFIRLDMSLLDEENVTYDFGIVTFLATVGVCHRETNPIRRCFISTVMPQVNSLYGPPREKASSDGSGGKTSSSGGRQYSKKYRNKLWLLKLLSGSKDLIQYRRSPNSLGPDWIAPDDTHAPV